MSRESARRAVSELLAVAYVTFLLMALLSLYAGVSSMAAMFSAMSVAFGAGSLAVFYGWSP